MNICVFCSAYNMEETYSAPARELARLIGEGGHNLVWGGSNRGLMEVMATGVQAAGGKIFGVSTELYKEFARKDADEMEVTANIGDRKARMLERSDAFVILVGGLGTLDELTDVLELKKSGLHTKPIIVLNSEKFYDGLKLQLENIEKEGFLPEHKTMDEFIKFVDTPEEVIAILSQ